MLKDSGAKRTFSTGAVRDTEEGKIMLQLLPLDLLLDVGEWFTLGAKKYGDNNWRKGQPQFAVFGSLLRHLFKYALGDDSEDHLSAVIFNALSLKNVDKYHRHNPDLYNLRTIYAESRMSYEKYMNDAEDSGH